MLVRVITLAANMGRLDVQAHAPIVSSNYTLPSPRFLTYSCFSVQSSITILPPSLVPTGKSMHYVSTRRGKAPLVYSEKRGMRRLFPLYRLYYSKAYRKCIYVHVHYFIVFLVTVYNPLYVWDNYTSPIVTNACCRSRRR